jgi:hypothetical protein
VLAKVPLHSEHSHTHELKCRFGYPPGVQGAFKGEEISVKRLWFAAPGLVLALLLATTATAAQPGSGS